MMLTGCVKAVDHLPTIVLKDIILPIFQGVWEKLWFILDKKS